MWQDNSRSSPEFSRDQKNSSSWSHFNCTSISGDWHLFLLQKPEQPEEINVSDPESPDKLDPPDFPVVPGDGVSLAETLRKFLSGAIKSPYVGAGKKERNLTEKQAMKSSMGLAVGGGHHAQQTCCGSSIHFDQHTRHPSMEVKGELWICGKFGMPPSLGHVWGPSFANL